MDSSRSPEGIILNVRGHSFRRNDNNSFPSQNQRFGVENAPIYGTLERGRRYQDFTDEASINRTGSVRLPGDVPRQWNMEDNTRTMPTGISSNVINLSLARHNEPNTARFPAGRGGDRSQRIVNRLSESNNLNEDELVYDSEPVYGFTSVVAPVQTRWNSDTSSRHQSGSNPVPVSRRIYQDNVRGVNDLGFQSDDNIWTSRLKSYQNNSLDKYGRRVGQGLRPDLDTGERYSTATRKPRVRQNSADGILDEEVRIPADLTDEEILSSSNNNASDEHNHLNTEMKSHQNYGSLPDCRPGGSILKKSNDPYLTGGRGASVRHSGTLNSHTKQRKGSHRSARPSRRVLFKNNVDVYRFDSEDSACSSSETERLNSEPLDRSRYTTRHRSASSSAPSRQIGRAVGERYHSFEDVNSAEMVPTWVLPSGRQRETNSLQRNGELSTRRQGGTRRAASVERTPSSSSFRDTQKNLGSYYDQQRQTYSAQPRLSVHERAATPGPQARRPDISRGHPVLQSSISAPQPERPRLNKTVITSTADTNNNVVNETQFGSGYYNATNNSLPAGSSHYADTTDGMSNVYSTLPRARTVEQNDLQKQKATAALNRLSLDASMLDRFSNPPSGGSTPYSNVFNKSPARNDDVATNRINISEHQQTPTVPATHTAHTIAATESIPYDRSNTFTNSTTGQEISSTSAQKIYAQSNGVIRSESSQLNEQRANAKTNGNIGSNGSRAVNISSNGSSAVNASSNGRSAVNASGQIRRVNNISEDRNNNYAYINDIPSQQFHSSNSQSSVERRAKQASNEETGSRHSTNQQPVSSSSAAQFRIVTESDTGLRRLLITTELLTSQLTPRDIRVTPNKAGNVISITVIATKNGNPETISIDRKLTLPVSIDPYRITAKPDDQGRLIIEGTVV